MIYKRIGAEMGRGGKRNRIAIVLLLVLSCGLEDALRQLEEQARHFLAMYVYSCEVLQGGRISTTGELGNRQVDCVDIPKKDKDLPDDTPDDTNEVCDGSRVCIQPQDVDKEPYTLCTGENPRQSLLLIDHGAWPGQCRLPVPCEWKCLRPIVPNLFEPTSACIHPEDFEELEDQEYGTAFDGVCPGDESEEAREANCEWLCRKALISEATQNADVCMPDIRTLVEDLVREENYEYGRCIDIDMSMYAAPDEDPVNECDIECEDGFTPLWHIPQRAEATPRVECIANHLLAEHLIYDRSVICSE